MQCPLGCGPADAIGAKAGRLRPEVFEFYRCQVCRLAFVGNPWLDYEAVYSEAYYRGEGADPLVDYVYELENPAATVRQYEWRGILRAVEALRGTAGGGRWLDYGCGGGGLVRHARSAGYDALGFEEGWIRTRAAEAGIPLLDRSALAGAEGAFDIVTAIEVIEHVPQPLDTLREIHGLLRPGGLLFLTTANAQPWRDRLLTWGYAVPEIHVSYFEPPTLDRALRLAGLEPRYGGFAAGFRDIIRFKILKNLGRRNAGGLERLLPWPAVTRLADRVYRISAHPHARRPVD